MNYPVTDASIDRLVDGDLNETERRDLLIRLENDSDGWRRLALAFLEDQAFRSAIRPAEPAVIPAVRPKRGSLRFVRAAAAIAATFLLGLTVGGATRKGDEPLVAKVERKPDAQAIREVGLVRLHDPSAGESDPSVLPIVSGPGLDEAWLRNQPSTVSDYDRARWERQGYQVEERRRLVSVVLDDGRKVAIPVDEVQLKFVAPQPL